MRQENSNTESHKNVLSLILKNEGGLNEDEPEHVGGISYAGITQKTYDAWKTGKRVPDSVRDLETHMEVVERFYTDYFTTYHVWELPECLQYIFADFVVNAGSAAVKIIQGMVDIEPDGVWGTGTSHAVANWKNNIESQLSKDQNVDNKLIMVFHEKKLEHYRKLASTNPEKYGRYLPGWERRCNHVLVDLSPYFESEKQTAKAHDEDEELLTIPTTPDTPEEEETNEKFLTYTYHDLLNEIREITKELIRRKQ